MTVTDRNVIDFTYVEDGEFVLCISDHLPWDECDLEAHWVVLQDKIKDYMGFVLSGQYRESCPDESLTPAIKVYFSHEWPPIVEKFLDKMGDIGAEFGCSLTWVYDPQDQDSEG